MSCLPACLSLQPASSWCVHRHREPQSPAVLPVDALLPIPCLPARPPARLPACPPACLPFCCCSNYNTATEETSASQLITLVSKAQLYMEGWALRGAPSGVPLNRTFIANVAPLALDPSNTVRRLPAPPVQWGWPVCVCLCGVLVCV